MKHSKLTTIKRQQEYKGCDDTAFFIHHNKTHRSASEAFRDADYATAFWKENSEWDDFCQWCRDSILVVPLLAGVIALIYYVLTFHAK